jgi:pyruvate,water dikinase
VLRRAWSAVLLFLEVIGLRAERRVDYDGTVSELKLRYFQFRDLVAANNELLEIISQMEARLLGPSHVPLRAVREQALSALTSTHRMVRALNAISGGRYPALDIVFIRIQNRLSALLAPGPIDEAADPIVPLGRLSAERAPGVGAKMACLGEIRNRVGLRVPEGFAVTVAAFRRVIEAAGGAETFRWHGPENGDLAAFARAARSRILAAPVPGDVAAAIRDAYRCLGPGGGSTAVAVRSSALDEDTDVSFAGQYLTLLNVRGDDIVEAYRQVIASAYEPAAVMYRHDMGLDEADLGVGVGVLVMVDALASGVAFSSDPLGSDPDCVLVHAVWGLGASIVDGRVDPDVYLVPRAGGPARIHVGRKETRIRMTDGDGVVEETVAPADRRQACLEPHEAEMLARWVLDLERHFGGRQDVEWALDRSRSLVILQSRPAAVLDRAQPDEAAVDGADLLLEGGSPAAHGAGCGPVVILRPDESPDAFPDGGVLVASRSSPRFVRVMKKAAAIVTDVGSAIGHMASLAREFRVPTIVGAAGATSVLTPGEIVTVDATRARVYRGQVAAILEARPVGSDGGFRTPARRLLEEIAQHIVPLGLTDPRDDAFTPLACTTLHDLARYIHERSFQEMFGISALVGDFQTRTPVLDVFLPIDLHIIDLGGGLTCGPDVRKVRRNQIASEPFAALVDGMLHKGIPRFGARSMDTRGFVQIVLRQAFADPEADATLRDPCYAIISDAYVNLAARVGFHFSAVDGYCCDFESQNYLAFRFKGGAADTVRRTRRAEAIARILRDLGFTTDLAHDLVTAQYVKQPKTSTLRALEMLGRLLQFMRQMDAAMTSDEMVDRVVDDFLSGRYGLEPEAGAQTS